MAGTLVLNVHSKGSEAAKSCSGRSFSKGSGTAKNVVRLVTFLSLHVAICPPICQILPMRHMQVYVKVPCFCKKICGLQNGHAPCVSHHLPRYILFRNRRNALTMQIMLDGVWHSMSKVGTFDEDSGTVWYGSEKVSLCSVPSLI